MYGCESWTIKKVERLRFDAFELWCWRRLLRVPWAARRSNQSILEEISPGISLEGMMLKLKLQYFGHLMRRVDSLEKPVILGGIWGQEDTGTTEDEMAWWHHWLNGCESEWTPGVGDGQGGLACCDSWGHKESDMTERLNWTELNAGDAGSLPGSRKIPRRRNWLPTQVFTGFPGGSDGNKSACNAEDLGSIPELGRSPGGGHGNPLQYSCLENPHGQRSLADYIPWGCKEWDRTD